MPLSHYPLSHFIFFFNDTATTEIYTLSLHDALPILEAHHPLGVVGEPVHDLALAFVTPLGAYDDDVLGHRFSSRSEEHTSELQSRLHLVCRLLLEKKK